MSPGHLQDRQKQDLAEIIDNSLFTRDSFSWKSLPDPDFDGPYAGRGFPNTGPPEEELVHKDSGYRFTFELHERISRTKGKSYSHAVEFRPGREAPMEEHSGLDWDAVCRLFARWLLVLEEEIHAQDPWEELYRQSPAGILPAAVQEIPADESFSAEEQEAVSRRLDDLEQQILDLREFKDEEVAALQSEVEELRGELGNLKKWNWIKLGLGTPFRIASLVDLSPNEFNELMRSFIKFMSDLPSLLPPAG